MTNAAYPQINAPVLAVVSNGVSYSYEIVSWTGEKWVYVKGLTYIPAELKVSKWIEINSIPLEMFTIDYLGERK